MNKNKFVFIIPSYNNELWYTKNLDSVFNQTYKKWRIIYVNDCSTDNTYDLVKKYINKEGYNNKTKIINNKKNYKQAYSRYIAYNICENDEIAVMLDGDDWLANNYVLEILNNYYNKNDIVCTYGSHQILINQQLTQIPSLVDYNNKIIKNNNFKYLAWNTPVHLRTFKIFLLKTIPENFLKDHNGEWLKCCTDIAEMIWCLENSNGKFLKINRVLYTHNLDNSIKYKNCYLSNNINEEDYLYRMKVINHIIKYDRNFKNNYCLSKILNKFIIFIPYCDVYKKFIIECLESVENQLYDNYEIIIINDGSNDISIIQNYIFDKDNYKIINKKLNEGPASSKWTFIKYLQENIDLYSYNDIVIIIDGDDYLTDINAINIINNYYNLYNCWVTYGNCIGAFSDGYDLDILTLKNKSFRKNKWIYNHPRTFKLFTLLNFKENDFKYNNKWLTKGTDRPLLYNILELSGHDRIKNINEKIYYYREHSNNSYKTVEMNYRKEQLNYIINNKQSLKIDEDIHIVMCSWKRIHNLESTIKMLDKQTISYKIHFHILNNNKEMKNNIYEIIEKNIIKNITISVSNYNNHYYGFQRFIYCRDILLKKFICNYVIFIDDDQLFEKNWVEKMYNLRKPQTYFCWYVKKWKFSNIDYWNDSIISYKECKQNIKTKVDNFHYGGTGGSIIDINIFNSNSLLWNIQKSNKFNIYNIEDLWLSFVIINYYNWNIKRSNIACCDIKDKIDVALYTKLYKEKNYLLKYLLKISSNWIKRH
jgi:glycosyltransferase involved in cell wall biosynthesis